MEDRIAIAAKSIIQIPRDFLRGNLSPYELVRKSGYFKLHDKIQEAEIIELLKQYPKVIEDWLQWSDDKRCSSAWYFNKGDDNKYFVAHHPEGDKDQEIWTEDGFKACAGYIKREIESIRL